MTFENEPIPPVPVTQCLACDTLFLQAEYIVWPNYYEIVCPHPDCGANEADFVLVSDSDVSLIFYGVIGMGFDLHERQGLRYAAEAQMLPFSRADRLR